MIDRHMLAPHAVARWAGEAPARTALSHVDGRRETYAELDEIGRTWATGLERLGVGAGDHVGTFLPHDFDGFHALLGIGWLQAVEVPLNRAYTGAMLQDTITRADVTTLVTCRELAEQLAPISDQLPTIEQVVVIDDPDGSATAALDLPFRIVGRDELLSGAQPADRPGPDYWGIAALLYTSGTTGPSKPVRTPWGVVHYNWAWVPDDTFEPGEPLYCSLPLFHNAGRGAFNTAMARGGTLATRHQFSVTDFWDDVRATGSVAAALVGPLTGLLYAAPPRPDDRDHPLRNVVLGPMIPEIDDFKQRFGVRVCVAYGQTEIGCAIVSDWDHGPWNCSGKVFQSDAGHEVRIVDEHDQPLGPREVGELVVRTAEPWSLNAGYYGMPAETAEAWRNGWFHTGDALMYDEDGWFYFVDRMKDTIRRRGENISSFEVETAIGAHPAVAECAAVGVPIEHGDEEVMVAVISDPEKPVDPAELIEFAAERLPAFMVPRYVAVVDDLPRSQTTSRVRKNEIRDLHLERDAFDRLGHRKAGW